MADAPTPNTPPAGAADAASAAATSASTAQPKSALDRFLAWCLRHWFLTGITLLIGSCAFMTRDRTVTWEEEVPLNTGETIWVTRSMPWIYKGGMGNPFDMDMRANWNQTLRFVYAGKEYSFTGVNWMLLVAISPQGTPVLVAEPQFNGWSTRFEVAYYCVLPYYVHFNPGPSGTTWTWPEKIDPWLYNLPANLMVVMPKLSEVRQSRYTVADRAERDSHYLREVPSMARIDPLYKPSHGCPEKQIPLNQVPQRTSK